MTEIVQAIDPATIARVIEANINAYLLSFAKLPGATLHREPHIVWGDSGRAEATFNAVVFADLPPDNANAQIEAVLAHFRRHSRRVTWHLGPSTRPLELDRFLIAHGMTHDEDEPGMAVEIDQVRDDGALPSGLSVETVSDDAALEAWIAVWLFPVPSDVRKRCFDVFRARSSGDDPLWRLYLGRMHGEPVATSELFVGEGAAGVHHVVTVPAFRRQGIGTAMTLHVLRKARAMGYRLGALTASPDGLGVYRRIGFREYCWFRRYE